MYETGIPCYFKDNDLLDLGGLTNLGRVIKPGIYFSIVILIVSNNKGLSLDLCLTVSFVVSLKISH
jgi:hypothetical protein